MEKIDLKLDESNELLFKVTIEGTTEHPSAIRFVCEADDLSYMFKGSTTSEPGEIRVVVPPMDKRVKEGIYEGKLEVLIEGRYLSPLGCLLNFKPGVKVVAESVKVEPPPKAEIRASASIVARTIPTVSTIPVVPTKSAKIDESVKPKTKAAGLLADRYAEKKKGR